MGKRTVLLVENEAIIAVLTRMDLENMGFEVEVASTGADAIRLAREYRPDIVLMDFKLNGELDGADTANEIQTRFKIPVIFLTGSSDLNNVQKCLSTKPVGFIHKPCRTEDLKRVIGNAAFRKSLLERFRHSDRYPYHDELTGLSNRRLMIEEIRLRLESNSDFALLYIDIDRFKQINHRLGYPGGDRFLQLFAAKLEIFRRPDDHIARMESDEFAVLMNNVRNINDAISYSESIHSTMKAPFLLNEAEILASLKIGIAYSKAGYEDPDAMLNDAENAIHQSSEAGKATAVYIESSMPFDDREVSKLLFGDSKKPFAA